jgi:hypothetical protein
LYLLDFFAGLSPALPPKSNNKTFQNKQLTKTFPQIVKRGAFLWSVIFSRWGVVASESERGEMFARKRKDFK